MPLLVQAGNGVKPREDIGAGKVYLDLSKVSLFVSTGAPTVLQQADCGAMCTNDSDAEPDPTVRPYILPVPPADGSIHFRFYDQSGLGIQIQAPALVKIRIGAGPSNVSSLGGSVTSTMMGQMLSLHSVGGTEWVAEPTTEPWSLE